MIPPTNSILWSVISRTARPTKLELSLYGSITEHLVSRHANTTYRYKSYLELHSLFLGGWEVGAYHFHSTGDIASASSSYAGEMGCLR